MVGFGEYYRRRINNMAYTISDNYGIKFNEVDGSNSTASTDTETITMTTQKSLVSMGLSEKEALDTLLFCSAHEGAHVKHSDIDGLQTILQKAADEGANVGNFNLLCQVAEDYRVDMAATKERPGYIDLRNTSTANSYKLFKDIPSEDDDFFNLIKAVAFETNGGTLKKAKAWKGAVDWGQVDSLSKDVMRIADESTSSTDLLNRIYEYYVDTFGTGQAGAWGNQQGNADDDAATKPSDKGQSCNKDTSNKDKSSKNNKQQGEEGDGSEADDEDDGNDDDTNKSQNSGSGTQSSNRSKTIEQVLEELKNEMQGRGDKLQTLMGDTVKKKIDAKVKEKQAANKNFTSKFKNYSDKINYDIYERPTEIKPLWTKEQRELIKKEICVGVHAGVEPMYFERVNRDTLKADSYYNAYRHKNYTHRNVMDELNSSVKELSNRLREWLKAAREQEAYLSNNGSHIKANIAWKPSQTTDNKVFFKSDNVSEGGYVVDIVLDSSGSQCRRRELIWRASYTIAAACSEVNIPCRVVMFSSHDCLSRLEQLRGFDECKDANKYCFNYDTSGDNRDGICLKAAYVELKKRPEENKIMIVLSDGAPNNADGTGQVAALGGLRKYCISYCDIDNGIFNKSMDSSSIATRDDLCSVVRDIRRDGVALMGIYVGGLSNLPVEKCVYGNDFAYIHDMTNFVPVVSNYLHKQIVQLEK